MNTQPDIAQIFLSIINRLHVVLHADSVIFAPFANQDFLLAPTVSGKLFHPETENLLKENGLADLVLKVGTVYLEDEQQYLEFLRTANRGEYNDSSSTEGFWHREKIQSSIFLRLQSGTHCVGAIFINYRTRQLFSPVTKELVEVFALLMASAITTNQLLRENLAFSEMRRLDSLVISMSEIVGSLAHDSGNLLHMINMRVSRLNMYLRKNAGQPLEREKIERFVADIIEPLDELTEDFQRLKEFRGFDEFNEELCRMEELIDNTLRMLSSKLASTRTTVKKSYSPTPPILCDRNQIQHLLLNLCLNALEAMGGKGILSLGIKLYGDGDFVQIKVSDTGAGISPELHSNIFQPHFTTKPGGLGTGLPVSRNIVEKHGGRIEFTSKPGKGTSFFIYLPVSA